MSVVSDEKVQASRWYCDVLRASNSKWTVVTKNDVAKSADIRYEVQDKLIV